MTTQGRYAHTAAACNSKNCFTCSAGDFFSVKSYRHLHTTSRDGNSADRAYLSARLAGSARGMVNAVRFFYPPPHCSYRTGAQTFPAADTDRRIDGNPDQCPTDPCQTLAFYDVCFILCPEITQCAQNRVGSGPAKPAQRCCFQCLSHRIQGGQISFRRSAVCDFFK